MAPLFDSRMHAFRQLHYSVYAHFACGPQNPRRAHFLRVHSLRERWVPSSCRFSMRRGSWLRGRIFGMNRSRRRVLGLIWLWRIGACARQIGKERRRLASGRFFGTSSAPTSPSEPPFSALRAQVWKYFGSVGALQRDARSYIFRRGVLGLDGPAQFVL